MDRQESHLAGALMGTRRTRNGTGSPCCPAQSMRFRNTRRTVPGMGSRLRSR